MDSYQLQRAVVKSFNLRNVRVVASDKLPYDTPGLYIVNTEPSEMYGRHWLVVVIYSSGKSNGTSSGEFFDSFGKAPEFYGFNRIKHYTFNTKCVQAYTSTYCWAYCLYYLFKHVQGMGMSYIVSLLDDNVYINDKNILNRVRNMFLNNGQ